MSLSSSYKYFSLSFIILSYCYTALFTAERVQATAEHPFYVLDKGWTSALELADGDKVRTSQQGQTTVVRKRTCNKQVSQPVYNLEIVNSHTYFISNRKILVHNQCNFYDLLNQAKEATASGLSSRISILTVANIIANNFKDFPDKLRDKTKDEDIFLIGRIDEHVYSIGSALRYKFNLNVYSAMDPKDNSPIRDYQNIISELMQHEHILYLPGPYMGREIDSNNRLLSGATEGMFTPHEILYALLYAPERLLLAESHLNLLSSNFLGHYIKVAQAFKKQVESGIFPMSSSTIGKYDLLYNTIIKKSTTR